MPDITFTERLKSAWNAFFNKDPTKTWGDYGAPYSVRPDRTILSRRNERTIVSAIYNRIAEDASSATLKHVKLDKDGRFVSEVNSYLNNCLQVEANADQTGRAFLKDAVLSLLDEGYIAIVPTDVDEDPTKTNSWDVMSMRTAKILEWYPQHVKVQAYDERDGQKKERIFPKSFVCILENPFFAVMNAPNSTLQRLIRKLYLMDAIDEQNGSNKLDLIIQLPYIIKTEARQQQAENRRKAIEQQLASSKYGIAYTDATEHITQLNRPVENNLLSQVEYLSSMLYSQLGINQAVLDGTADEKTMQNYYSRTIEPILSTITKEMVRKFLTKTARTQRQSIEFFRDPFKLIPANEVAELADKMTRNEIMTSNEFRQIIGLLPSKDPNADELRNKNLSTPAGVDVKGSVPSNEEEKLEEETNE